MLYNNTYIYPINFKSSLLSDYKRTRLYFKGEERKLLIFIIVIIVISLPSILI